MNVTLNFMFHIRSSKLTRYKIVCCKEDQMLKNLKESIIELPLCFLQCTS